jgi:hypothetical protein
MTEPVTYVLKSKGAALVLCRIMQEPGDGLIFVTAVLDH